MLNQPNGREEKRNQKKKDGMSRNRYRDSKIYTSHINNHTD